MTYSLGSSVPRIVPDQVGHWNLAQELCVGIHPHHRTLSTLGQPPQETIVLAGESEARRPPCVRRAVRAHPPPRVWPLRGEDARGSDLVQDGSKLVGAHPSAGEPIGELLLRRGPLGSPPFQRFGRRPLLPALRRTTGRLGRREQDEPVPHRFPKYCRVGLFGQRWECDDGGGEGCRRARAPRDGRGVQRADARREQVYVGGPRAPPDPGSVGFPASVYVPGTVHALCPRQRGLGLGCSREAWTERIEQHLSESSYARFGCPRFPDRPEDGVVPGMS